MSKTILLLRSHFYLNRQAPPLGLAYLAAVLNKKGFKPKIIDNAITNYSLSRLLKKISLIQPLAVCFTSTTPNFL